MNLTMQAADAFRENIKTLLRERDMSISALGRAAGVPQSSMSKILSGHESVTLQRADRIAIALGVRLGALLEELVVAESN